MNTKITVSILLLFSFSFFGQNSTDEKKDATKVDLKEIDKKLNIVLEKFSAIEKKDEPEEVGVFSIIKGPIRLVDDIEIKKEDYVTFFVNQQLDRLKKTLKPNDSILQSQIETYIKDTIIKINDEREKVLNALKNTADIKKIDSLRKKELNLALKIKEVNEKAEERLIKDLGTINQKGLQNLKQEEKFRKVERVKMFISEGMITDILVVLKKGEQERYFTNRSPISLLRYFSYEDFTLKEEGKEKNKVKLFDVLRYEAKRGRNYAPNDVSIELDLKSPLKTVELNNNLHSLFEYRIYSDFLGLIGQEPNGIASFEAFSNILLSPKNLGKAHFLKKITPYVNYSRIDSVKRTVVINNESKIDNKISLIQKSFLKAGASLQFFEYKWAKEHPFYVFIPLRLGINLTETSIENKNITTINYGGGIGFSVRKIHNFGFNFVFGFDYYNPRENHSDFIKTSNFWTYGVNAELDYYDSKNKSSAFFLRLGSQRILKDQDIFTSVQLGYKASISFGKQKAN